MTAQTAQTPREMIRGWIETYAAANEELSAAAIERAARERFVGDTEFAHALVEWALGRVVRSEAKRVMQAPERVPLAGGRSVSRASLERKAAEPGGPWAQWRQRYCHIDAGGNVVELPDMTRENLLDALDDRKSIAREAIVSARFLDMLAKNIGPAQRVRDVFSPEQLVQVEANAAKGGR
ncbi:hypothetical protein [Microcystis phage Mae-JY09]